MALGVYLVGALPTSPDRLQAGGAFVRLFDMDDVPVVPLFREPPPGKGALIMDERIDHDYPPAWKWCPPCCGRGKRLRRPDGELDSMPLNDELVRESYAGTMPELLAEKGYSWATCPDCLGMGSVKAMVRLLAGHRCERCKHPYMPKGDAKMLGVEPTPHIWSPCDETCEHKDGELRWRAVGWDDWFGSSGDGAGVGYLPEFGGWATDALLPTEVAEVQAMWRILTVHHLDGDKANLAWWNLAALCQRCHLHIQAKVVMERVYPHEHSEWFKPHAAGWYAKVYLGEDATREQALERMDELLALERMA